MLAKIKDEPWHKVVKEVETTWNNTYVSWFGVGPPNTITWRNFDVVVEALYDRYPLYMQSLYSVGSVLSEEDARKIFKYVPDERILVSLKTISKIIRNPVGYQCRFSEPLIEFAQPTRLRSPPSTTVS